MEEEGVGSLAWRKEEEEEEEEEEAARKDGKELALLPRLPPRRGPLSPKRGPLLGLKLPRRARCGEEEEEEAFCKMKKPKK